MEALSIKDKLDIINKVQVNLKMSRVAMAKDLDMLASTLNMIMAKWNEILAQAGNLLHHDVTN